MNATHAIITMAWTFLNWCTPLRPPNERTIELVLRNTPVPKKLRPIRRKTVNMQLTGLRLVVSITHLTRDTAEFVSIPPTLLPVKLTTVLKTSATVLTVTIMARVAGVLLKTGPDWVTRHILVAITAVVRTSVEIGAGFLTVLSNYDRSGNRVDPLYVVSSNNNLT